MNKIRCHTENNRYIVLFVISTIYIIFHIATLKNFTLPWFDETYYASMADSLFRFGSLFVSVDPIGTKGPINYYGPVYFIITGLLFKIFGINIQQFRLPGLLFGFGIIVITIMILRQNKIKGGIILLACMALSLDHWFNQEIHNGRMDSTALFFILLSFYFILKSKEPGRMASIYWCIFSAVLAAIGVLTTPRVGPLVIPIGLILVFRAVYNKNNCEVKQIIIWSVIFSILILSWLIYAFENLDSIMVTYLQEYSGSTHTTSVGYYQYPLFILLIIVIPAIVIGNIRNLFDEALFFSISGVAIYCFFITGPWGFFFFFSTPLIYIAIAFIISSISNDKYRKWINAVFILLISVNGSIFIAQACVIFGQWDARCHAHAEEFVERYVPRGSKVVGDYKYYYAVRKNGSEFQHIDRGGPLSARFDYHKNIYNFEYLITSMDEESEPVQAYMKNVPLVKIASLHVKSDNIISDIIIRVAGKIVNEFRNYKPPSYAGTIYKRVS